MPTAAGHLPVTPHPLTKDFNGDGKSDILWRNSTSGEVDIWHMNGTTLASGGAVATLPAAWQIQGTGDFNGDGKSDILWRNTTRVNVDIWHMNGTTLASGGAVATSPCRLADSGHRRLQRRWQERHPLAQHHFRRNRYLAHERHHARRRRLSRNASPPTGRFRAPATSTATARATSSGATPHPAK